MISEITKEIEEIYATGSEYIASDGETYVIKNRCKWYKRQITDGKKVIDVLQFDLALYLYKDNSFKAIQYFNLNEDGLVDGERYLITID